MLGPTEGELDMFERALVWEALERGPPLLGICRGAQMITVALGGTLHQHLPACVPDALPHRRDVDMSLTTHPVRVARGSRLAAVLGERIEVDDRGDRPAGHGHGAERVHAGGADSVGTADRSASGAGSPAGDPTRRSAAAMIAAAAAKAAPARKAA